MDYLTGRKERSETLGEYQINDNTLVRWCRILEERGRQWFGGERIVAEDQKRIAERERAIGRLTMELEVSKKASEGFDTLRYST